MPKRVVPEGEGKRVPVMSRTTKELRAKLEEAAAASGRSLGQEVEYRLEQSFARPPSTTELLGGPGPALLAKLVAVTTQAVQAQTGASWETDPRTRSVLYRALKATLVGTLGDGEHPLSNDEADREGFLLGHSVMELLRQRGAGSLFPAFSIIGEPEEKRQAKLAEYEREASTPGTFAHMMRHPEAYPLNPEEPTEAFEK
ncbi:TraY domain-containing protein [Enterovirga sp. CN4-39]|uniref:TraY domain-containing protein n=1 Tax=Enterovirga sp. CN4-39 TaxID=3400910 RepID=UPI003C06DF78